MERDYKIITNPNNKKASIYKLLGYEVLNNNLHIIAGKGEEEYDKTLKIGFEVMLFPQNGRGLPYPVDVALEKALAVSSRLTQWNVKKVITTDACWSDGDTILNKPGEAYLETAVEWWMKKRGAPIWNVTGSAWYDVGSGNIGLWCNLLHLGTVNREADHLEIQKMIREFGNSHSGGVSFFPALSKEIILSSSVRWQRHFLGSMGLRQIPPVPSADSIQCKSVLVDHGELSLDLLNQLSISGLIFGIDPHGSY